MDQVNKQRNDMQLQNIPETPLSLSSGNGG